MKINDLVPRWIAKIKEQLNDLFSISQNLINSGNNDIKRGLEKIKTGENLNSEVVYLRKVISNSENPVFWDDDIAKIETYNLINSVTDLHQNFTTLNDYEKMYSVSAENYHDQFLEKNLMVTTASGTAMFSAAHLEQRYQALSPTYEVIFPTFEIEILNSRDIVFNKLKDFLSTYKSDYVNMLEGSENSLNDTHQDHLSQAAHSMRDCVAQIIEELAPTKVVKEQPWYTAVEGAPNGVSRRYRIRYMVYGSGESVDKDVINQLDDFIDRSLTSLNLAMERAHDHSDIGKEEVQLTIDQTRFALLELLKRYNNFWIK